MIVAIMKKTDRTLRFIVLIFFLFLFTVNINADRVQYTYDASGNRTYSQKEIIIRGNQSKEGDHDPRYQDLSLHRITIFPNPTDGRFSVEITGNGTLEGASITLYGASGSIVYYDDEVESVNEIDITLFANGIYLLIIRVDGKTSSWKIIKI